MVGTLAYATSLRIGSLRHHTTTLSISGKPWATHHRSYYGCCALRCCGFPNEYCVGAGARHRPITCQFLSLVHSCTLHGVIVSRCRCWTQTRHSPTGPRCLYAHLPSWLLDRVSNGENTHHLYSRRICSSVNKHTAPFSRASLNSGEGWLVRFRTCPSLGHTAFHAVYCCRVPLLARLTVACTYLPGASLHALFVSAPHAGGLRCLYRTTAASPPLYAVTGSHRCRRLPLPPPATPHVSAPVT